MGEVYRATDTKLGREVALKVLPVNVAGDADRLARFQREARAVAALNHPNVVTLYSVEECGGTHFLTMEMIEGQSLDRLIPANGLPLERIVEIAGALADALCAAHEKGILHRDLKPANVMVTNEGRVKVLDFGLAKDVGAETTGDTITSAGQTQAGMVMGTPAYMSPEQVSGRALDQRTDIFSLGVVLHEMATGHRPFEGTSSVELITAILRDSPAPVTEFRADLPDDLARVIRRCLEKDPRHRLQTARDVANEFRDMTRSSSRPGTPPIAARRAASTPASGMTRADEGFWIAVLPFKYTGSNADLAAVAEGMSEDIITAMSRFSYLRVIARGSTARYAQQAVDVRTVAKELGARYVLEGSLRQAGAKVRIAAQLVDAETGAGLWAETYDRTFTAEGALDLLDDVVPRIVSTVGDTQGILAHSMTDALRHRDPETLTPYEAVLRSFGYHQLVNEAEHKAGITALEQAVKKPPVRADCWAMLSWLYRGEFTHGFNARPDPLERGMAAARHAIELDPANSIGHAALASIFFCMHDFAAFRTAAQRALSLNRMEGYATAYLGLQMAYAGDWEEGCAIVEQATQLNPNHPGWYWFPLAINAYRKGDGKRALEYAVRIHMPGLWTTLLTLTVIYSQVGEMEKARETLRSLLALRPNFQASPRGELGRWWRPEMVEQLMGDLRKAGLETA
jgi:TolB-like protein